jgi:hypothetical protein
MPSLPRALGCPALVFGLALALTLLSPKPHAAKATSLPCVGLSPAGAVGSALGIGNPVGDACEAVTDPILGAASEKILGPLEDAAKKIGNGVFNQITAWVADGAVWLLGEVAQLTEKTTSPNLLGKGFLKQYELMAVIAGFMAALMAIFVVFESLASGDPSLLARAFLINLPLAAIATSASYVVVQLLIASCDGLSQVIAHSAGADAKSFFKGAIEALAEAGASVISAGSTATGGPTTGPGEGAAGGTVTVPLFVGFLAAILAAFAAFFVWIELLMRDAAIYVVALFMPLSLAASIWPRWSSALRRTAELLIVLIFSKFVIVAIVSLAASLLASDEGGVEHVLAAGAMLLLACFSPAVLLKLVPFAEGAMSAAYSRQSATGGAVRALELTNSVLMVQRLGQANWGSGGQGGESSDPSSAKGDQVSAPRPGGGKGASGAEAAGAGEGAAGPQAVGIASAQVARQGAERLSDTASAQIAGESPGNDEPGGQAGAEAGSAGSASPRAATQTSASEGEAAPGGSGSPSRPPSGADPEPSEAAGGSTAEPSAKPPRPPGGRASGEGVAE